MIERRRFSRIIYQAPATLTQGDYQLATCIQDLSLKGLLLWAVDEPELDKQHRRRGFHTPRQRDHHQSLRNTYHAK